MKSGTFGALAEHLAALLLRLKGYQILARQLRTARGIGAGEIDIVAKRGRTLAFVEVKAHATASNEQLLSICLTIRDLQNLTCALISSPLRHGRYQTIFKMPGKDKSYSILISFPLVKYRYTSFFEI